MITLLTATRIPLSQAYKSETYPNLPVLLESLFRSTLARGAGGNPKLDELSRSNGESGSRLKPFTSVTLCVIYP